LFAVKLFIGPLYYLVLQPKPSPQLPRTNRIKIRKIKNGMKPPQELPAILPILSTTPPFATNYTIIFLSAGVGVGQREFSVELPF
jgi:hypothetical protein